MSGHVQDLLSAYLDGELSPPERAMVEAHLAACDACAARLEDFAALDEAVRALPLQPPEGYFDDFAARVRTRVRARGAPVARWHVPVWGWAVAAAVIVAVVTPLALRETRQPSSVAAPSFLEPPSAAAPSVQERVEPAEAPAPRPATPARRSTGADRGLVEPPAPSRLASAAPPATGDTVDEWAKAERMQPSFASPPAAAPGEVQEHAQPRVLEERPVAAREDAPAAALGQAAEASRAGSAKVPAAPAPRLAAERDTAETERKEKAAGELEGGVAPPHGNAAAARGRAAVASPSAQDDAASEEFALLRSRTALGASTLEAARELRDDWRSFAARNPAGARGDEARWQVIEAGWRAFHVGRAARDRAVLVRDARTYLERGDASHAERVRALVSELERE